MKQGTKFSDRTYLITDDEWKGFIKEVSALLREYSNVTIGSEAGTEKGDLSQQRMALLMTRLGEFDPQPLGMGDGSRFQVSWKDGKSPIFHTTTKPSAKGARQLLWAFIRVFLFLCPSREMLYLCMALAKKASLELLGGKFFIEFVKLVDRSNLDPVIDGMGFIEIAAIDLLERGSDELAIMDYARFGVLSPLMMERLLMVPCIGECFRKRLKVSYGQSFEPATGLFMRGDFFSHCEKIGTLTRVPDFGLEWHTKGLTLFNWQRAFCRINPSLSEFDQFRQAVYGSLSTAMSPLEIDLALVKMYARHYDKDLNETALLAKSVVEDLTEVTRMDYFAILELPLKRGLVQLLASRLTSTFPFGDLMYRDGDIEAMISTIHGLQNLGKPLISERGLSTGPNGYVNLTKLAKETGYFADGGDPKMDLKRNQFSNNLTFALSCIGKKALATAALSCSSG